MKKKTLFVTSIIVGILILVSVVVPIIIGVVEKTQASIGVIGGADGPTSIMIVGVVSAFGSGSLILKTLLGVMLIVIGHWWLKRNKS